MIYDEVYMGKWSWCLTLRDISLSKLAATKLSSGGPTHFTQLANTYESIYFHALLNRCQWLWTNFKKLWQKKLNLTLRIIGLSKERPILGYHPKAHILDFHEIRRISHEIWWISCEIQILWNLADFMKSWGIGFPLHSMKLKFLLNYLIYKVFRWISWNPPDFMWNLLDFMKSAKFHVKSTGFRKTTCQEW